MSSSNQKNSLNEQSENVHLIYCPVMESTELFQKRFIDVQSILARMVLIGRKKGRPSEKEINYEEAA